MSSVEFSFSSDEDPISSGGSFKPLKDPISKSALTILTKRVFESQGKSGNVKRFKCEVRVIYEQDKKLQFSNEFLDKIPDVVLQIEGRNLSVHRALLQEKCGFFEGMFHGEFQEGKSDRPIPIFRISYEQAFQVIQMMYAKELIVTPANYSWMGEIAARWQIQEILDQLENFSDRFLRLDKLPDVLALYRDFPEEVMAFLAANAHYVLQDDSFLQTLELDILISMIQHPKLQLSSLEDFLRKILKCIEERCPQNQSLSEYYHSVKIQHKTLTDHLKPILYGISAADAMDILGEYDIYSLKDMREILRSLYPDEDSWSDYKGNEYLGEGIHLKETERCFPVMKEAIENVNGTYDPLYYCKIDEVSKGMDAKTFLTHKPFREEIFTASLEEKAGRFRVLFKRTKDFYSPKELFATLLNQHDCRKSRTCTLNFDVKEEMQEKEWKLLSKEKFTDPDNGWLIDGTAYISFKLKRN